MKVVRIIARLNVGGPAKQAVFLASALNHGEFRTTLVTGVVGAHEEALQPPPETPLSDVCVLPTLGRDISWWQDLRTFIALCRILKQAQPDIVHTHTAKAGTLGRLAAMWARVPLKVHTFHGHVFHDYFGTLTTKVFVMVERWLARRTDRIVVVSDSQRRELSEEYRIADDSKFEVIPLGFNLSPFGCTGSSAEARETWGVPAERFVIGFVGRLVPIKNPMMFLDVVQRLGIPQQTSANRASEIAWHALIIGDGNVREALVRTVDDHGIEGRVAFCGWQHDMAPLYAAMDVVVLTSLNEGTPVTLIEAMASEKPFVATRVGGVVDLTVGEGRTMTGANGERFTCFDNGILVDAHDAAGMAAAVQYLAVHPEAATRMGRAGREFAFAQFDEQRLLGDVKTLYRTLLRENGMQTAVASHASYAADAGCHNTVLTKEES